VTVIETGLHYPLKLDNVPNHWEVGYVGDFAENIEPGFASGEHNQEGTGVPHLRPMNIDRTGKIDLNVVKYVDPAKSGKRLRYGDVLFNNTNSPELIGKTTAITNQTDWAFSNHMTRIAFSERVDPKFAAYQLHFLWMTGYFLHKCVKHVNQASVSSTTLARAVPFIRPPLDEQKTIVAEIEKQFSRLDEAVANLKRVKANLKRYKATVLKAAVEGKLTEDWRMAHADAEPASELLKGMLTERRAEWERRLSSRRAKKYMEPKTPAVYGLTELPERWIWASLDQLMLNITDGDHQPPPQTSEGIPFIVIGNVRTGVLDFAETRFVSRDYYESLDEMRKPALHDLLYTLVGSYGICVPVETEREFCIQRHIAILRPYSGLP
jgi:type I restriction enzyme, S subunit